METQTTDLRALSDAELSRQLTDCRITLESIYPYRDKATSAKQAMLRAEFKRRDDIRAYGYGTTSVTD